MDATVLFAQPPVSPAIGVLNDIAHMCALHVLRVRSESLGCHTEGRTEAIWVKERGWRRAGNVAGTNVNSQLVRAWG